MAKAKSKHVAAVISVIEKAVEKKKWSYARLTKHINKGENTLHRWRSGKIASFDIDALVKLFTIAGESMDETFGILPPETDEERAKRRMSYKEIRAKLDEIDQRLDELDSLKRTFQAFSLVIGGADPASTKKN